MHLVQDAPQTVILAEDEALLYLQATTTRVWAPQGQTPHVAVHPGREKVSFYGTLNLHTGEQYLMQADKMNAATSAQHLEQLLTAVPKLPILLLWDRAPWHHGAPIRHLLADHPRLQIHALPTAAPDLNPQEHVWKAARAAVSHNHRHRSLAHLAERFAHHLRSHTFPCSLLRTYGFTHLCPIFN